MRNLSPFAARLVPLEAQIAAFVSTHFGTEQEDNVSFQRKAKNFQPVFAFSLQTSALQHLITTLVVSCSSDCWIRWHSPDIIKIISNAPHASTMLNPASMAQPSALCKPSSGCRQSLLWKRQSAWSTTGIYNVSCDVMPCHSTSCYNIMWKYLKICEYMWKYVKIYVKC